MAKPASSTAERPRLWDATDALAWVARDILRNRQEGFPAAVAAGKLTPEQAATGLRIAAAIASDWTTAIEQSAHYADSAYVADMAARPLTLDRTAGATHAERHQALSSVLRHPKIAADPAYAELVEALIWWEEAPRCGRATIAQLNAINAECRARAQTSRRSAA